MTKYIAAFCLLPLLGACTTVVPQSTRTQPAADIATYRPATPAEVAPTRPPPQPSAGFRVPQIMRVAGLEHVIESDRNTLLRLFGAPRLDVVEGDMRKLQFAGEACVLDIFLYPLRQGGEPVATFLETRRSSDGMEVDRRACIAALSR